MISIIVPVYNVKDYLTKCIESILRQTYKNFEVILVDDGSTDGSSEICDFFAKNDKKVKVIHQENAGLVNARKVGLTNSSGDFIMYVDGDDWIEENLLKQMYDVFCQSDADILCVDHYLDFNGMTKKVTNKITPGVYSARQISSELMTLITPYLWSKFFRKEMLMPYQMAIDNRIVASEDAVVTYPLLSECKRIIISDICGYHYVQRKDSMMNRLQAEEKNCCDLVIDYLMSHIKVPNATIQLDTYRKLLYDIRLPYNTGLLNNLKENENVIIYGAGAFGKTIYRSITSDKIANVIAWLDRDYIFMQNIGYSVHNPDEFDFKNADYDRIIIAISNYEIAKQVEVYLQSKGAKNICRKS